MNWLRIGILLGILFIAFKLFYDLWTVDVILPVMLCLIILDTIRSIIKVIVERE